MIPLTASESANRGNFFALLEFRVDAEDVILKSHLATCHATARYSKQDHKKSAHRPYS